MEDAINTIGLSFKLTENDAGEYAAFKAAPLSITLKWYYAEGLGNVSMLHGKALGGLMQMDTLVINPSLVDMPLFSYDYISVMGKHTMLVEYYDTMLNKESFNLKLFIAIKDSIALLNDYDLGTHWYDSIKLAPSFAKRTKKSALNELNTAFSASLASFLAHASKMPRLDESLSAQKLSRSKEYVRGLLENGGPSSDALAKALGKERTTELFTKIIFGTE